MNTWNLFAFSTAALSIASFALAIFILKFGKGERQKIWVLYNLSVAIWGVGGFWAGVANSSQLALFWWRFSHIGVIFIPIFLLHGILLFCENKKFNPILKIAYIQGIFFASLIPTNYFFKDIRYLFSQFYYPVLGSVYHIFLVFWIGLVILSQAILFSFFLKTQSTFKKRQILYLFVGLFLGFSGGLTNFLPGYFSRIYPFGNFGIILYSLIITYAIFKYRLLDVSIAFTRASIFIAVYSLIIGVPLAVAFVGGNFLRALLGSIWWIIPLFLSTFLGTVGPFIYLYIDGKAEQNLLKDQKKYQNILKSASSGMMHIKNLDRLLKLIVYIVCKIVRVKFSIVYLKDNDNYILKASRGIKDESFIENRIAHDSFLIRYLLIQKEPLVTEEIIMKFKDEPQNDELAMLVKELIDLRAAVIVPSSVEDKLIGFIILGEKKTSKLYSQDDLAVFSVLANQAAMAIENAQFYDEIKRTQESLFQAEKMATLGTMADGLSHQINNRFHALSLIAGDCIDVIKTFDKAKCDEETCQIFEDLKISLGKIQANVLQGGEVVKGLLKYSRPGQSGFEKVFFKDVMKGAVEMVGYKIKLKEIDLINKLEENLTPLNGNAVQLQEVFFNLIDNAYDAIQERLIMIKEEGYRGKVEITALADKEYLHISVQDNGMGIKEEEKRHLFTPFFTTKATAKKGTGLGLYVIEKIIAGHGGQISIASAYKVGTCFTISLPIFKN